MESLFAPPPRPVTPGLYIVATPIGNLRDITLRALDVLRAADVVLAEDTRVAGKLLSAYDIKKPLLRYDDHAGPQVLPQIIERLRAGHVVAQISDAGTPLISDPGFRLVEVARETGANVHPIPGASSVLAALCLAGLPTDRFMFAGFLPNKSAARRTALGEVASIASTLIFFETGPRLHESLKDMTEVLGDRQACVCRELTKLYESAYHGRLSDLVNDPHLAEPKGEIVIIVAPPSEEKPSTDNLEDALKLALEQYSPSDAAQQLAHMFGLPRKVIYQKALEMKGRDRG
ncbi:MULTISPECIES: 16S rRNA (cytidine(1402)-2'-O)-methyltransferase [Asticcacaulis]|uniref:16S rRNA (cytidine(1402)-2'-O)-methyltransferase n=1 Tax=Asticcacaulis TaxID=76890 RepID=UPI001AE11298|nr:MULTISPECIES: 16S rRNA (cytidine(1402)-2'-O)-methyltransferase [Asticcacaulis]MBP2159828.1 16S rRNA (cytidine1402-2'-O)-methyltransferase [Asticcacaulis solisilvae]MDR6800873.1 16S rRNA (cytidine1402-2'-O)-methyltransferase [Asticcacaulis sp. BE141]